MFWPFHFPCFDISAVHVLIGDLTSSSYKLISKAEREKEKKKKSNEKSPPNPTGLYLRWNPKQTCETLLSHD